MQAAWNPRCMPHLRLLDPQHPGESGGVHGCGLGRWGAAALMCAGALPTLPGAGGGACLAKQCLYQRNLAAGSGSPRGSHALSELAGPDVRQYSAVAFVRPVCGLGVGTV
jgi:hypothetical protein